MITHRSRSSSNSSGRSITRPLREVREVTVVAAAVVAVMAAEEVAVVDEDEEAAVVAVVEVEAGVVAGDQAAKEFTASLALMRIVRRWRVTRTESNTCTIYAYNCSAPSCSC